MDRSESDINAEIREVSDGVWKGTVEGPERAIERTMCAIGYELWVLEMLKVGGRPVAVCAYHYDSSILAGELVWEDIAVDIVKGDPEQQLTREFEMTRNQFDETRKNREPGTGTTFHKPGNRGKAYDFRHRE